MIFNRVLDLHEDDEKHTKPKKISHFETLIVENASINSLE